MEHLPSSIIQLSTGMMDRAACIIRPLIAATGKPSGTGFNWLPI
jgi:hypothetical protein